MILFLLKINIKHKFALKIHIKNNKELVQEVTDKLSNYVSLMNKLLLNIYNENIKLNESFGIMHRPNNEFNKILSFMLENDKK